MRALSIRQLYAGQILRRTKKVEYASSERTHWRTFYWTLAAMNLMLCARELG